MLYNWLTVLPASAGNWKYVRNRSQSYLYLLETGSELELAHIVTHVGRRLEMHYN
jgi:hypothetical protein